MTKISEPPGLLSILRTALYGAIAGGVLAGTAEALRIAHDQSAAMIRERLVLFLSAQRHARRAGIELLDFAPTSFSIPFDMSAGGDVLVFVALVIVLYAGVALVASLVLLPFLALLLVATRLRPLRLWQHFLPFAVLGASFGPLFNASFLAGRSRPVEAIGLLAVPLGLGAAAVLLRGVVDGRRWLTLLGRVAALTAVAALLVIGPSLGFGTLSRPSAGKLAGQPNVLLISIDSLRADHLGCYGYPRDTSPNIDRLAAEGARFATAVAPSAWTLPSHLTMVTGLAPVEHGVVDSGLFVGRRGTFLAEVLHDQGYATAGFVSGLYVTSRFGYAQGFDHFDDYSALPRRWEETHSMISSPIVVEKAERWLDRWQAKKSRRPFFVFLHMFDVHFDYTPPPPYDRMFAPDYDGLVDATNFRWNPDIHPAMAPGDLDQVVSLYDGEIRHADLYVGRLLDRLRSEGLLDDTVVVLTSDHGDEFYEHGRSGHGQHLLDSMLLVPLIMRYPAVIPAGRVVDRQVRLMDIGPTILEAAGLRVPAEFGTLQPSRPADFRSLVDWIRAEPDGSVPGVVAHGDHKGVISSVRTDRYKLVRSVIGGVHDALYDLEVDPEEQRDVARQQPEQTRTLIELMDRFRQSRTSEKAGQSKELSDQQREILRSLGYVE
jgi:arylsulfatase A-like enzyme